MSALEGSCHCGAITVTIPHAPPDANQCNCSICRRLATLWGYYRPSEVCVTGEPAGYRRSDLGEPPGLTLWHCPRCGCTTHWTPTDPEYDRMGVNLRNFAPELLAALPLRHTDGASW